MHGKRMEFMKLFTFHNHLKWLSVSLCSNLLGVIAEAERGIEVFGDVSIKTKCDKMRDAAVHGTRSTVKYENSLGCILCRRACVKISNRNTNNK